MSGRVESADLFLVPEKLTRTRFIKDSKDITRILHGPREILLPKCLALYRGRPAPATSLISVEDLDQTNDVVVTTLN